MITKNVQYFVLISFLLGSCSFPKSKLYLHRESETKNETLQLDLKKKVFYYQANSLTEEYTVFGDIEEFESSNIYRLSFPFNAELEALSPFEKSFHKIQKVGDSKEIVINISQYDIRYKSLNNFKSCSLVSKLDSSEIKTIRTSSFNIPANHEGDLLKFGSILQWPYLMELPAMGIYEIELWVQHRQSFGSYASTDEGCYLQRTMPQINIYVCNSKDDRPMMFDFDKNCKRPFYVKIEKKYSN